MARLIRAWAVLAGAFLGLCSASDDMAAACEVASADEAASLMLLQTQTALGRIPVGVPQPDMDILPTIEPWPPGDGSAKLSLSELPGSVELSQEQALLTEADADVAGASAGAALAESVTVQDVLGLVGTMGIQQRQQKHIAGQLQKAQEHEKRLKELVKSEKQKYAEAELSISAEHATVDRWKEEVSTLKTEVDGSEQKLVNKDEALSEAQQTLKEWRDKVATSSEREQQALQAQKVTELRVAAAEARERNALKAGELEDRALKQQSEYLQQLTQEREGEAGRLEMPWEKAAMQPRVDPRMLMASAPAANLEAESTHHATGRHHHHHHSSPGYDMLPTPVNWVNEGV